MTYLESLTARRDAIAAKLAGLEEGDAGELPDVTGEGEVKHTDLRHRQLLELDKLNAMIDQETNRESWEFSTRGRI